MSTFNIPTRDEVNSNNQAIFDNLAKQVGMVPNLYAYFAKHDTALGDYLSFSGRKSTLNNKEKEVVNLTVSEINGCRYCQSAHTAMSKMNGFNDNEIIELRQGHFSNDSKLNALAELTASATVNRGKPSEETVENFFAAGYSEASLIDVVFLIADKTFTNFIGQIANIPIDFPVAPELESAAV